jgi:hypothetical protein
LNDLDNLTFAIADVLYPARESDSAEAVLKLTIDYTGFIPIKLRNIRVTTFFGGYELGSKQLEDALDLKSNSQATLATTIDEDWGNVPLFEKGLFHSYILEATMTGLLYSKDIRLIYDRPLVEALSHEDCEDGVCLLDDDILHDDDPSLNLVGGGPPRDGIPPIEDPKYISAYEADETLEDDDIVFVAEFSDAVRVYPREILVWHEVVNDEADGGRISITYCPLTGSAIGYMGEVNGTETTFGTSGKLLNSNLVMYDRATESYWSQILGASFKGPMAGSALRRFPLTWTTWELARQRYPDAEVLSRDTGHFKPYDDDPYGSYKRPGTYYTSGGTTFPLDNTDDRLDAKTVVVAMDFNGSKHAIEKALVADAKVVNLRWGFDGRGDRLPVECRRPVGTW